MTYCLAISLKEGLVLASDSRTNAGVDYVATYSKMTSFSFEGNRSLTLLTSGSLATSQAVLHGIRRDLADPDAKFDISKGKYLHDVAEYIGELSQKEQTKHAIAMSESSSGNESSFLLGGQIAGQPSQIFLIYPQGNFITTSTETPYLQIGESKYGKPIIDRLITPNTSLEDAARCALISLDSTIRSNVSVGPPIELAIHTEDIIQKPFHSVLAANSPLYKSLRTQWNEGLREAFSRLPRFEWEEQGDKP